MTPEQRRQQVEDACAAIILAGQQVTFDDVAARTGLGRATLYRNSDLRRIIEEHRARGKEAHTLSGLTTEIALVLTVLVGGLAIQDAAAAAAVAVVVAMLLAARERLHHFVGRVLSEEEVQAALVLAAAAIVVLPLLPDRPLGPFAALNPRTIWRLVILVLAIGASGHVAVRALGPRFGLPIAGLASGFVSSSATIGAMGSRAAKSPEMIGAATAGAVLPPLRRSSRWPWSSERRVRPPCAPCLCP